LNPLITCIITPVTRNIGAWARKCLTTLLNIAAPDSGYAALADVVTKQQVDEMQSFVLAETFKYFYLLFASPETLQFDKVIFNTEAHPLKRTW